MINQKNALMAIIVTLFCSLLMSSFLAHAETVDRIVAVVEDDVILESELQMEESTIRARMAESKAQHCFWW